MTARKRRGPKKGDKRVKWGPTRTGEKVMALLERQVDPVKIAARVGVSLRAVYYYKKMAEAARTPRKP